jgi:hypothetical protein
MDGKLAFLDIEARGSGVRAMQRAIFDVRPFPKDYTYRMGRAMLQPCQVSDPLPWQKWAMA